MLAGEDGNPLDHVATCRVSNKDSIEKVIGMVKAKFGKEKVETRMWYRYMVSCNWKLVSNHEHTVEELGLSFGDKLILEAKTGSKISTYNIIDGWPRDKIPKDEPQWEVGDKVDVYLVSVRNHW
jgi:hypothetical protein